ncbi:archaellar assembly protein FlaJ [Methanocella arvoryzae]|uniref:archaellar assembly protein FlaJ n=1 Tax=Methanocella arvoryzae TaxID=1175445 RepID=UPI00032598DC|nr:archaellar assembly protein FlaJ [Methanocella arvoryzae]
MQDVGSAAANAKAVNKKAVKAKGHQPLPFEGILRPIITYLQSYAESGRIDIDLMYTVTYMNTIATADLARDEIFRRVAEREDFVCSKYFKQVYMLAKNWNYEYAYACQIVAKSVANKRLKDFLMRLANAMSSGEPESKFLESEYLTMMTIYKNEYERSLESLKKWTDAYTALLVSMAFVAVTMLLSVILYNLGDPFTMLMLTVLLTGGVGGIAVFVINAEAPKEYKTHRARYLSIEQKQIKDMQNILIPGGLLLSALLFMLNVNIGFILIVFGMCIAPIGFIGMIDDKNIDRRDRDFSQFIKMLGSMCGGMGVTVKEGIKKVDQKSIGSLDTMVQRVYVQLMMGMDPKICWEKFVGSTGSELIHKFTYIFLDSVEMGGDPVKIGKLVNSSDLEIVLLRMKRNLTSSSFTSLAIPLHISMSALIIFIVEIMIIFSTMISKLYSSTDLMDTGGVSGGISISSMGFNLFQNVDVTLLSQYMVLMVLVLTLVNTLASKCAVGGDNYKLCYYGAIMCVSAGLCLIIVPVLVQSIFNFPTLTAGGL